MEAAEQALKLRDIARLTRDELRGWWLYVCTRELRPAFDGERAALLTRARELEITLSEASA